MTDPQISPDLQRALDTPLVQLTQFEGLPVRQAAIEIPGAAGGLRESMRIQPQEFHKGERVFVVLECEVGKIRFDPIDKDEPTGDQRRVHVFNVEDATIVDESLVREHLDAQKARVREAQAAEVERLKLAEEQAAGIERLDAALTESGTAEGDDGGEA